MHTDQPKLVPCSIVNDQLQLLLFKAAPLPTPDSVSKLIERTFRGKLNLNAITEESWENAAVNEDLANYYEICCEGLSLHMARMACASSSEHEKVLSTIEQKLKPNDIVLIESMDLSTGHCFPNHNCFGRFQEILALYQQAIGHPTTCEEMEWLIDGVTADATIQMGVPVKLRHEQKNLSASILECIRPCMESTNMVPMDEYDAVIAELKRIGQDTRVSMRPFTINRIIFII